MRIQLFDCMCYFQGGYWVKSQAYKNSFCHLQLLLSQWLSNKFHVLHVAMYLLRLLRSFSSAFTRENDWFNKELFFLYMRGSEPYIQIKITRNSSSPGIVLNRGCCALTLTTQKKGATSLLTVNNYMQAWQKISYEVSSQIVTKL